jgi:small subunit ribosomal protein S18
MSEQNPTNSSSSESGGAPSGGGAPSRGRPPYRSGPGGGGGGGRFDRGGGGRRPRRFHRGKVCQFCVDHTIYVDHKDLERLRRYIADSGKILPRRVTGNCARHQRMINVALKRARMMALMPFRML